MRSEHDGLIRIVARRFEWATGPGLCHEDLMQEGRIAAWLEQGRDADCALSTRIGYAARSRMHRQVHRFSQPLARSCRHRLTARRDHSAPEEVAPLQDEVIMPRLAAALGALSERERNIISLRFVHCCTLEEIGTELGGLCRERVRQLLERALDRLRECCGVGEPR